MPAAPNYCQSRGVARTYTLKDGRTVELRNGCVVDQQTRHTLAGSNESVTYLLSKAKLTAEEREWLTEFGLATFQAASGTPMSRNEVARMKQP